MAKSLLMTGFVLLLGAGILKGAGLLAPLCASPPTLSAIASCAWEPVPPIRGGRQAKVELTLSPAMPTSADFIWVTAKVGSAGEGRGAKAEPELQPTFRVLDASVFFVEILEEPVFERYLLGVLPPGDYTFILFQQRLRPDSPGCTHEVLGELRFHVQPAGASTGSGRLALLLQGVPQDAAQEVVERENPSVDWLLDRLAVLRFIPGLEATYRSLLAEQPEVESVELDLLSFVPECPPPLGPAFAPGALLVSFRERVSREEAETLLRELPPEFVSFLSFHLLVDALGLLEVRVPAGWEGLFLQRYQRYPEVVDGWVGEQP